MVWYKTCQGLTDYIWFSVGPCSCWSSLAEFWKSICLLSPDVRSSMCNIVWFVLLVALFWSVILIYSQRLLANLEARFVVGLLLSMEVACVLIQFAILQFYGAQKLETSFCSAGKSNVSSYGKNPGTGLHIKGRGVLKSFYMVATETSFFMSYFLVQVKHKQVI